MYFADTGGSNTIIYFIPANFKVNPTRKVNFPLKNGPKETETKASSALMMTKLRLIEVKQVQLRWREGGPQGGTRWKERAGHQIEAIYIA